MIAQLTKILRSAAIAYAFATPSKPLNKPKPIPPKIMAKPIPKPVGPKPKKGEMTIESAA